MKRIFRLVVTVITIVFAIALAGSGKSFAQGTWTTKAPMPTPRVAAKGAVVNGRLYVFGGGNCAVSAANNCILPTVEEYDPTSDASAEKAPMPIVMNADVAVAIDDIVYVYGKDLAGAAQPEFLAYNASTDTWSFKAPVPTPRADSAAAVVGGILYLFGGYPDSTGFPIGTNEAYDPASDTWSEKAPMALPLRNSAAAAIGGILYTIGGSLGSSCPAPVTSTGEAYNPGTNAWTSIAPMPTARNQHGAGVISGILYALGGTDCVGELATNEAYDPSSATWSSQPPMPTPRHALAQLRQFAARKKIVE
jgi:N-acetylneuraminic acid mutarotase